MSATDRPTDPEDTAPTWPPTLEDTLPSLRLPAIPPSARVPVWTETEGGWVCELGAPEPVSWR